MCAADVGPDKYSYGGVPKRREQTIKPSSPESKERRDRKSVVEGKSVSLGGRLKIKKKKKNSAKQKQTK